MGKTASKQRELEETYTEERDKLFKEFSYAKKEIERNFSMQRADLEDAFQIEISKLFKIHQGQINTIKLQMRDSQLGEMHEKLRGKLSRHLSWPIAESTPKQSKDSFSAAECSTCGKHDFKSSPKDISKECEKTVAEWHTLVQHLKFALNNQKSLFEGTLLEEKLKMKKQLEMEKVIMEENIFKRLNETLQSTVKERDNLIRESTNLQHMSRTLLSDWVLINTKKMKQKNRFESDSEEEYSGDSGVEEKTAKIDKRGNYWRMKHLASQKKYVKKSKEAEESFKEQEQIMIEDFEKTKTEMAEKHAEELNDVHIIAAKELQKCLKEERHTHKGVIKEMNEKIISISSENEELKEKIEALEYCLASDMKDFQKEFKEKLEILKDVLSNEDQI